MLADEDHGIECVPEPTKILALPFGEFHGAIVKIAVGLRALKPNAVILIKSSNKVRFVRAGAPGVPQF